MICGIDEAGRGPVIGPMVIAGVKTNDDADLIDMGVKDSKRLAPSKRRELKEKIERASEFTLRVIPAENIDSLRKSMSLNELESDIFANLINDLCDDRDTVYVDSASTDEEKFRRSIEKRLEANPEIVSEHEADDSYPVVSAASILAKVRRDEEVENISKDIGRDIGSGYPSDTKTRDFLQDWITENGNLPPYTRKSWETCRELMNKYKTRSLDKF